ncbi:MAG TPA: Xaa-Pro peptidase family protein [Vicinamibacterales bacterium]|nr:Xaa-Pro peptidase family protein [Vicinamibacterales bacterium]
MQPLESFTISRRFERVRRAIDAAAVDALLVTHLPNIRYLTGFAGTAGALLVLPDRRLLLADSRYVSAARSLTAALESGLVDVEPVDRSYDESIAAALRRAPVSRVGIEAAHLTVARFNMLSASLAETATTLVPTERIVERARMRKDDGEVALFREAAARLSSIARRLTEFAVAGRTEREVADAIEEAMRRAGFSRPAFETIVASGPNSALPHASPTDRVLQAGDPTVLDFGGVYSGYCVDLTRTVQLGGISGDIRHLFEAVAEAQKAAIGAVRPGVRPSDVDGAARTVLERHGLGEAFGHGTGHGLGLEIHEDPRVGRPVAGQPDDPLEPGVVITIEPGAYVPGFGGVRIEDDVLVTADGCEVLTNVPTFL